MVTLDAFWSSVGRFDTHLALAIFPSTIWVQLFKTNDIVSSRFIKIYIEWYANMLKFFAEKMWVAYIFSAKNIRILYIESARTVNEMTLNELVKLNDALNNWAPMCRQVTGA